jgi:hypothetical protein
MGDNKKEIIQKSTKGKGEEKKSTGKVETVNDNQMDVEST